MRHIAILLAWLCAVLGPIPASAQSTSIGAMPASAPNPVARPDAARVALIIGNSDYRTAPLANPLNDARDMAKALSALGFDVTLKENATLREQKQAIRNFAGKVRQGGVGLFYFAGHGVQSKGKNFLIPVDADIQQEYELEDQALDANLVLGAMDEAQSAVNILILDACRNNPFMRSFRSASRGLAQMDAPKGSFIAYATAPGSVAADGIDGNGTYTKHLLRNLQQGDSDISKVFSRVRAGVAQETRNQQIPWESTSMVGDFFFNPAAAQSPSPEKADKAALPVSALALEITYWQSAEKSNTVAAFQSYLSNYPSGQFADLAKARIATLSKVATPRERDAANPGDATVTFFRPSGFVGSGVTYVILLDGREIGTLSSGSVFTAKVPSGTRTVGAEGATVGIQRSYEFVPSGSYFVQLDYAFLTGLSLRLVSETEAKAILGAKMK
ncbi:MAG: caspase family protein [Betaproteobacteria bacterium]|nr:caspase family protein [Betaproteobacteria bacterium]